METLFQRRRNLEDRVMSVVETWERANSEDHGERGGKEKENKAKNQALTGEGKV